MSPLHNPDSSSWPTLLPGDIVDIIAPSRPALPEDIEIAKRYIASLGLAPRVPADLMGAGELPFLANSDAYRLDHLLAALKAPDSKAVWCLLGGYGAMRLLPHLPKNAPGLEKLFLGFSDITALHLYMDRYWGWRTVHAPMPKHLGANQLDPKTLEYMQALLFNGLPLTYPGSAPLNEAAQNLDAITAPLIGGNLSLVRSSIGTSWQMNAAGKIVILEDIGERGYQTSRMLEHCLQAGLFDNAAAILFGTFTDDVEKDGITSNTTIVLDDFANRLGIPVFRCNWFGHGETNYPLVLGVSATLSKDSLIIGS